MSAVLAASCTDCGGIKAVECEPQPDNRLVQEWIERGDIVGAELEGVVRYGRSRCECGPATTERSGG